MAADKICERHAFENKKQKEGGRGGCVSSIFHEYGGR